MALAPPVATPGMISNVRQTGGMMTYRELWQILTEAEARVRNFTDATVKANSAETVALCKERMAKEGISRAQLRRLAAI